MVWARRIRYVEPAFEIPGARYIRWIRVGTPFALALTADGCDNEKICPVFILCSEAWCFAWTPNMEYETRLGVLRPYYYLHYLPPFFALWGAQDSLHKPRPASSLATY